MAPLFKIMDYLFIFFQPPAVSAGWVYSLRLAEGELCVFPVYFLGSSALKNTYIDSQTRLMLISEIFFCFTQTSYYSFCLEEKYYRTHLGCWFFNLFTLTLFLSALIIYSLF